jgi:hypothetical protein
MQEAGLVSRKLIPPAMRPIQGIPVERSRRAYVEPWARGASHESSANSPAEGNVCKKAAPARRQLGETIATYDVALALRGESGKFDVTSPSGEIHHVTCEPNHSIANLEWARNRTDPRPFLIRKIADPVARGHEKMPALNGSAHTRQVPPPFLSEHKREEPKSPLPNVEPASLGLLDRERDPQSQQPSACVVWKTGTADRAGQAFVTAPCAKNELTPEVTKIEVKIAPPVAADSQLLAGPCIAPAPRADAVSATAADTKSDAKVEEPTNETAIASSIAANGMSKTSRTEGKWHKLMRLLSGQISVRRVKKRLRVCETVSLGEKRFVAVVQVDGEEFLVGGASNSVCTLARLQRPQEFVDVLKQTWAGDSAQA